MHSREQGQVEQRLMKMEDYVLSEEHQEEPFGCTAGCEGVTVHIISPAVGMEGKALSRVFFCLFR